MNGAPRPPPRLNSCDGGLETACSWTPSSRSDFTIVDFFSSGIFPCLSSENCGLFRDLLRLSCLSFC
jgi:hypothetical protein